MLVVTVVASWVAAPASASLSSAIEVGVPNLGDLCRLIRDCDGGDCPEDVWDCLCPPICWYDVHFDHAWSPASPLRR